MIGIVAVLLLAGVALSLRAKAAGTEFTSAADLAAGMPAPDFTLQASDGRTYTLSHFKGRQAVVIAWFPKAFTGG